MRVTQQELGYDKKRWNSFWVCAHIYLRFVPVLSAATSGRLNWDGNWKSQRSKKLPMAYKAIEAAFPETRRFEGQWDIYRTVKQYWDNRRNYRNCVNNPTTFRGKEAAARRAHRGESPGTTSRTSPSLPRSPTAPRSSGSPTPGPSRPHTRPINCPRIDDSDDDSNGDDNEFLDASDPECALDEGNGNGGKSAKAKGKRKATTQGGKNPKQARRDQ
ncbi:hypothetical protein DFH08DRAFT_282487 [Mycena albidolilacea]|uniref:Uncharacterized protein n=1 Tax=Mycena albidolilacea TaxID=1033008 RepID=A0AAD6ZSH8_9AGAR|nr:hypothetical protein DFH08DRAFT_282487 [Mycena albidolilacea]